MNFKHMLCLVVISISTYSNAQVDLNQADETNTWLKVGLNTAVPVSDFSRTNSFGFGVDVSLQFLETKSSGIGVKVGYLHYLGKGSNANVGILPLALMFRYYPESFGWFGGLELGYAFINGMDNTSGGIFVRPQLGLHYDFWNFFVYYDLIVTDESNVADLQSLGVGATYNIRFKQK